MGELGSLATMRCGFLQILRKPIWSQAVLVNGFVEIDAQNVWFHGMPPRNRLYKGRESLRRTIPLVRATSKSSETNDRGNDKRGAYQEKPEDKHRQRGCDPIRRLAQDHCWQTKKKQRRSR